MRMDQFLDRAEKNNDTLKTVTSELKTMSGQLSDLQKKVETMQGNVSHINGQLAIIGEGTKMELFDTLYHWKKILVDERGWATEAEKREVKAIYEVYHDGLKGNGQGEVYYNRIMELPESELTK